MSDSRLRRTQKRLRYLRRDRTRRIGLLIAKGLIKSDSEIPQDAIPVDPEASTKMHPWTPELFYRDLTFQCSDCGKQETWTAESQQFYFENLKASPYKGVKRCYDCRQKFNAARERNRANASSEKKEPPVGQRE